MKMKFFIIGIFILLFILNSQSTFSVAQTPPSLNEIILTEEKTPLTFSNDVNRQLQENDSLSCDDFQFTCEYGTPEEVKEAIKNGADINCQDEDLGWTPLMSAILNESAQEIVTLLVEAGANINLTDWEGMNALMLAADFKDVTLVQYLLDHGAKEDVNVTEYKYGFSPLIWAAKNNETYGPEVIQALIKNGADVQLKDKNGFTAIFWAAMANSNERVIQTLIQNGADLNQIGPKNVTPLMGAIGMNNDINIVKVLLDAGADVTITDAEGKKAIDYAFMSEKLKGTEVLKQLADLSGVEITQQTVSPGVEITPSPPLEITPTPIPTATGTPELIITPAPTQVSTLVYNDPSGKFVLYFPVGFTFSTYIVNGGMIGANYHTPNEQAYLEIRSFPSSQDLQFYLSQRITEMALRGESSITSNGKTGNIKVYSRKTEQDELLTLVATYQGIDIALVVIDLPIAAYQSSSPWLLGLFKGINWEGKIPITDSTYSDPDQKFSFKLPDGVHFLYTFKEDFYFNQPYRFLPEANGMVGTTPDGGQVMIANFSTPEKYQEYLKEYDRRVENGVYQVHGTSQFDVQGHPAKLTLYSYLAEDQKRAELLAVYEGTYVVISVWLPADNYQAAQTWLLSLFKNLTWKKEETLPSFSPIVQSTPPPQITGTPQPTETLQPTASPQVSSDELSFEAATYIEKGDFQKAITLLKQSIAHQPDFGFAYGQLAYCYIQLKLYQEAVDELSDKLLPKKEYSTAYNLVGFAFENLDRLDEALVAYQKAVELDPSYVDAYSNLGFVYFEKEQYQKAADAFKKASELKPNDPVIFNNLGFSYEKLGKLNEALQAYQKAISINPDYVNAHNNLGVLYYNQDQYEKAIEEYKKSLELKSDNPDILYNLGLAYEDLEQYENAVQAFQESNRIKPDYDTYNSLGRVYNSMKKYQEALDSLQKSIDLNPENHYAYYNLGLAYEGLEQYENAISAYQEAIRIKPDYIYAYTDLGYVYYYIDRNQEAVDTLKKAIELNPERAISYYYLGLTYLQMGDQSLALKQYEILKNLDQSLAEKLNNKINQ